VWGSEGDEVRLFRAHVVAHVVASNYHIKRPSSHSQYIYTIHVCLYNLYSIHNSPTLPPSYPLFYSLPPAPPSSPSPSPPPAR
jgi:hypothetical protein